MDLEFWNSFFKIAGIIAALITAVLAGFAFYTETLVNKRQSERLISIATDLASARTRQAEAETRLASVELEGHAQRERAAKAERDLLELQERAKPRTIAPDARTAILAALAAKVPDGPIRVIYIGGSVNEPGPLAYSIAELLKEARWTVSSTSGGPYTGTPPTGILVRVSAADNPPPERASVLEQALAAGGLNPRLVRVTSGVVEDGEVELLVGLKP